MLLIPTITLIVALVIAIYGTVLQTAAGGGGPTLGLRTIAVIWREAAGRMLILTIGPLGRIRSGPRPRSAPSGRTPVLLIPGYGTNRAVFWFLNQFLAQRGWRWLWAVNHEGKQVLLADQAAALGRRVQRLKAATGVDQVDIVGFSMGGLIAARYVRDGGAANVRRLVTVGTPWRGTRIANLSSTPVGAELLVDCAALADLDPTLVPTTAIWSPDDPVVIPASSAAPAGCQVVCVPDAGHLDLMLNGRVFRAIQQALSQEVECS